VVPGPVFGGCPVVPGPVFGGCPVVPGPVFGGCPVVPGPVFGGCPVVPGPVFGGCPVDCPVLWDAPNTSKELINRTLVNRVFFIGTSLYIAGILLLPRETCEHYRQNSSFVSIGYDTRELRKKVIRRASRRG
jgi:hypothetical protein